MTVKLLIGPPASGKTKTCITKIQGLLTHKPLSKVWVLVPDSQSAAYFRRRLANAGGGLGVRVGTFSALFQEILEQQGLFTPVISPALEHRLLLECIDGAYTADELRYYAAIRHKPGFISAVSNVISELRSAYISADHFLQFSQSSTNAKSELAQLYKRFVGRLNEIGWIDRDGQIWQAIDILKRNPDATAPISLVVVDGFDAFAGARRQFLCLLSTQVDEMVITLPAERDSTRSVHRRALEETEKLKQLLVPEVVYTNAEPKLFPESAYMQKHMLEAGTFDKMQPSNPLLIEAHSQSEEAREALRWIKGLVRREDVQLDACAIFAADLGIYRPLLRTAANEFGIKVHFSHPEPLTHSAAIQAILNLLDLPGEDYPTRGLFNSLHSPFFDFQMDATAIGNLEAVSQHAHIVQGREQWEETWDRLEKIKSARDDELDDESQYKNPLADIDLSSLRDQFENFWMLFEGIGEKRSYAGWIAWLEKKLQQLHFYEQISREEDQEACEALAEALKALILSEGVTGEQEIEFQRFKADLASTLQSARLEEPRSAKQNALYIGKISEARASRYEAVVLLGFSEGVFPAVENPDPFLDEATRAELGLEPRLEREQASTFYQAFTRADAHLLLTRTYLGETGEAWEPSPYWEATRNLFDESAIKKISQGMKRQEQDAASPQELLFWAVQQNQLGTKDDPDLAADWQTLQQARAVLNARRAKKPRGKYEGYTDQITEKLAADYSAAHTWSASTFETYGSCPYQFFIQKALKLEEKKAPELGLDFAQEGRILHRILEKVYKQAGKEADPEHLMVILDNVCLEVFANAPNEFGFRASTLWQVEQAQLKTVLQKTIQALEAQCGDWEPFAFEAKFGIDGSPMLIVETEHEPIRLRGVIDRLDRNSTGEIRVIDYKRGGSNLSENDFLKGRRLQLPIYALAAQEALRLGSVKEGFYWIVNDANKSSMKLSGSEEKKSIDLTKAVEILKGHLDTTLARIRAGHFPPDTRDAKCPSYCPAKQWCWRYQDNQF